MGFLNKKIVDFSKPAFGIELSDALIRIFQFDKNGNEYTMLGYGRTKLAPGCIVDGEIKNPDVLVSAINSLLLKARHSAFKAEKAICSLPETKAFLRIISLPRMEIEEVSEAIKWEMETNIPMPIDQVYYSWHVLDENVATNEKGKMDVLVAAVPRKTVDSYIEVLEKSGIEVVGMEVESLAQAKSLIQEKKDKTTLIVNFDHKKTSFLISYKGIPCFTSSVPVSSQSLGGAISKNLGVDLNEAEKIKKDNGIGSAYKNDSLFRSVKPVLENLISEIERSIDFYLAELKYSENIDEIILCGADATLKGLLPYLQKRIGKKVILGDPWVNVPMGKKIPHIERNKSVEFSTVIGLAIRGVDYENIS